MKKLKLAQANEEKTFLAICQAKITAADKASYKVHKKQHFTINVP
jgi:hypothetical protein